jgi:hypothetical protein
LQSLAALQAADAHVGASDAAASAGDADASELASADAACGLESEFSLQAKGASKKRTEDARRKRMRAT